MTKALLSIAMIAIAAALLTGCGGGTDSGAASSGLLLDGYYVVLEGYPGPENVGILMTEKRGILAEEGLSMEIYTPGGPAYPIHYALSGSSQLAVTSEPQLVLAQEKGLPIVAVGSLVSQPTAAMIWLKKSGIKSVADLKGRTIAIPGVDFQKEFLKAILARAGLSLDDVKLRTPGYDLVPTLENGRADAIFGGSWNVEGAELEARGLEPVITKVQELGVPPYDELVVITRRDRLATDKRQIREFMSAVARGTAAAIEDPSAAVQAIKVIGEPKPNFDRKPTEAAVEATLPLLSKDGRISSAKARALVNWMHREGMIQRKPPISTLFTNRFVP